VAIDPAPFRGVLPLPISALRSASAALSNPANRQRAVPLTYDQFRYAFANAVSEDEAKQRPGGERGTLRDPFRRGGPWCRAPAPLWCRRPAHGTVTGWMTAGPSVGLSSVDWETPAGVMTSAPWAGRS
jgi:hypothetical protein